MRKIPAGFVVMAIFLMAIGYSSCYYDVEEELYSPECDTLSVTFSNEISRIVVSYCQRCHNNRLANGNVVLDSYEGIRAVVDDGRFLSSITHDGNAKEMPPPPATKIPSCDIQQIQAWMNQGAPNN